MSQPPFESLHPVAPGPAQAEHRVRRTGFTRAGPGGGTNATAGHTFRANRGWVKRFPACFVLDAARPHTLSQCGTFDPNERVLGRATLTQHAGGVRPAREVTAVSRSTDEPGDWSR